MLNVVMIDWAKYHGKVSDLQTENGWLPENDVMVISSDRAKGSHMHGENTIWIVAHEKKMQDVRDILDHHNVPYDM